MKIINIIDNGCDRYTIKSDCYCLGRQWDNLSEQMQIVRPEREKDHTCTMIVSADGIIIDHLDIKNEPKDITDVLSRHLNVEISFSFTDIDGYVKNSEIKEFHFTEARKPEDFIPSIPEQSSKLDIVLGNAFIRAEVENDILKFYNPNGDIAQEFPLPTIGEGSGTDDYNELDNKPSINGVVLKGNKTTEELGIVSKESDPTVPSYVKNITQQDINSWNNKVDNSVENLLNYYLKSETYTKNEVKDLINAINGLSKEIVDTLPTENINENTIYLVAKQDGSSNDYYNEYLYINGAFEYIGSTQVDLTNYVKNTDYGTTSKAGVCKWGSAGGVMINTAGYLNITPATNTDIDKKEGSTSKNPIVPSNLDYAVKSGLTDNKLEWTEEEKLSARNKIGAITDTDYATTTTGGVVKLNPSYGINRNTANNNLYINAATTSDIDEKSSIYKPIVPSTLDYAVNSVLKQRVILTPLEDGTYSLTINTEA